MTLQRELETLGYGGVHVWGGMKTKKYFTPDGREVWTAPSLREWVKKNGQGKIIASGTRDANLDRGLLLEPPQAPLPHCPTCDKWHNTQAEVEQCALKRKEFEEKVLAKTLSDYPVKKADVNLQRLDTLESELSEIKRMLKEIASGQILQRETKGHKLQVYKKTKVQRRPKE
uniref:Uncharacterized protein n=1 Tax=viral metagenome TaxID=1070528 RepID=A0A6M3J412_9ZZZZ